MLKDRTDECKPCVLFLITSHNSKKKSARIVSEINAHGKYICMSLAGSKKIKNTFK